MASPGDAATQQEPDPRADLTPAGALFAEFVRRREAGEPIAIEAFCAAHPEVATKLRRLHRRLLSLDILAQSVALEPAAKAVTAPLQDGGQRARRYTVGDEVARGGMSVIVRAYDRDLDRTVAMKILPSSISTPRLLQRFLAEAKVTGQLHHPCIVPVHDIGLDQQQRLFFTMPLIEGRDLAAIFALVAAGKDGWTLARAVAVLQRVCEAVAYAHSRGVLHRDLKPANVMVGAFGQTYVMDWGLARVRAEPDTGAARRDHAVVAPATSPLQTRAGDVIGTPVYMAPEQARGEMAVIGQATDVYAIGAMLYHLLTGALPYVPAGEDLVADVVLDRIRRGPPAPLVELAPTVPAELIAICERAMARVPHERYPSMQALADDLRAFLEVRVVTAYATGRLAELRQWIRRNRGLAVAISATIVALGVGFAVSTLLFVAARANQERADRELSASNLERARTLVRLGDMTLAESELWPQHFAGVAPRATHWALWETYASNRCLASIGRADSNAGRAFVGVLGAGERIVTGSADGLLRFFDGHTLRPLAQIDIATPILGLDVAPDGVCFALGTAAGIELWDATRQQPSRRLDLPSSDGLATQHIVRFARDGMHLAATTQSRLRLWRLDAAATVLEHGAAYDAGLAFDATSRWLAAGRDDGSIDLFDVGERQVVRELAAHQAHVSSLCFAGEPAILVSGSVDRMLRTWSIPGGECQAVVAAANGTIRDLVSLRHDGSVLACGWTRVDRWQPASMTRTRFAVLGGSLLGTDRAERLLWQTNGAEICLWELAAPADRLRLGGHANRVVSQLDPAGKFVATGDGAGKVRIFAIPSGRLLHELAAHATRVLWLRLDAATDTLVTVADDAVRIWNTLTWAAAVDASFLGDRVRCAQMDGRGCIASGTSDGFARVHEVATGRLLHEWVINPGLDVVGVAFSPDGERLAVAGRGPKDRLTLRTLATNVSITLPTPTNWEPVFSPDGKRLAVGTFSRTVLVFDTATGELRNTLRGHTGSVWTLAFHPLDPDLLVSGSNDGVVCFWDLASERQCARFEMFDGDVGSVSFADGGSLLAMSGLGTEVEVWDTTYYDRHIAGNLRNRLQGARSQGSVAEAGKDRVPEERAAALLRWTDEVLARPWPRFGR